MIEIESTELLLGKISQYVKATLGEDYFCFLPLIANEECIKMKIPVIKKENFRCEYMYLYEIDLGTGEIVERNNSYDYKKFLKDDFIGYDIQDAVYQKAYNTLYEFRKKAINGEFDSNLYKKYYEEMSLVISSKLKNIFSDMIKDKMIFEEFFMTQANITWVERDEFYDVPDDVLKFALLINEKTNIKLSQEEDNIDDVIIDSKIIDLCYDDADDYTLYSMEDLLNALENNNGILPDGKNIISDESNTWSTWADINAICSTCKYSRCPKRMAGYIKYLKDKGTLERKLRGRESYRNNGGINKFFTYNWTPENGLKNVPQNIFDIAYEMVKQNKVTVSRNLNDDKLIEIYSAYACEEYVGITDIEQMNGLSPEEWGVLERGTTEKLNYCDDYYCRMESCPIFVAGYIYYLIMSGQDHIIAEDRAFYKGNEGKIITDSKENKEIKLKEIKENNSSIKKSFSKFDGKVKNLNSLLDILQDERRNNLYCIIEGERGQGQNELVDKIVEVLESTGKIEETEVEVETENGVENEIEPSTIEMPIQNLYSSLTTQADWMIQYDLLKKNKLYVITGIEEFIRDYRTFKEFTSLSDYEEVRKKQIEHIIKLLGRIEDDTYIVILGENKPIENFLEINIKIKNIYRECHLFLPELSTEELYLEYKKNIKIDILEKLRTCEDQFKKVFFEFISLNRLGLPFNNVELAEYLALYSNSKNDLVLPEDVYRKETIDESLANIIGLDNIKKKLKEFEAYMLFRSRAKGAGAKLDNTNMHMIFTGNPGCGKTTIARIMAKMLFDMGVLKENKLIEVERKDLIASYTGQTAPKTEEIIQKAMGGVLFIDEAYSLVPKEADSDFGQEAIATLIKSMEDKKGEFVVIFAGYKDEMKGFVDSNPGIASRIGYTFDFPDYTIEELIEIYKLKMRNSGFLLAKDIDSELKMICSYFCKRKSFGNGRFIDKLIQETLLKHSKNIDSGNLILISKEDLPEIELLTGSDHYEKNTIEEELNNIIGLEPIKNKVRSFERYIKFNKKAQEMGLDVPNQNMHMIFTGNPGCGKTTIARIMAKMLFNMGLLHENKLVEVERKDLVAGYVGQTAPKTNEVIEKAMGGVLFIDEAYSLTHGDGESDFGQEAIATLIKSMEDHKGEFVVIFAGYKNEMKGFVDSNPGIASRIGYTFDFPDYTAEELLKIFKLKISKYGFNLLEEAETQVKSIMRYFCNVDNIGNGRFVDKVIQETLVKHSGNTEDIVNIGENDIPSVQEMISVVFNNSEMINPEEITEEAQKRTAIHEIGHAAVRLLLFSKPGIKKITINVEGTGTLGYVMYENKGNFTQGKSELLNTIKTFLAGMACEEIYLGEFHNGNTSDLEVATNIAENMVTKYGMSSLGLGRISKKRTEYVETVQEEINSILAECYAETIDLIKRNKDSIDRVFEYLIKEKEIDEDEFVQQFRQNLEKL